MSLVPLLKKDMRQGIVTNRDVISCTGEPNSSLAFLHFASLTHYDLQKDEFCCII